MGAEVARHRIPLPVRREMRAVHQFQSAEFRIRAGGDRRTKLPAIFVRKILRTGNAPREPLKTSAIGDERLSPFIERMSPRIAKPFEEHLDAFGPRIVCEYAAGIQPDHAPRRFEMGMDIDRLIEI